jgi:hypothetical protein
MNQTLVSAAFLRFKAFQLRSRALSHPRFDRWEDSLVRDSFQSKRDFDSSASFSFSLVGTNRSYLRSNYSWNMSFLVCL